MGDYIGVIKGILGIKATGHVIFSKNPSHAPQIGPPHLL